MDWIALYTDENWRAFWASEKIQELEKTLQSMLVNAQLDPESRGVLRGRLMVLQQLPGMVRQLAEKQQEDLNKVTTAENVSAFSRLRSSLHKVY